MRSSSREEIVEVLDALEAGYKRALDLRFDVLTTPERLSVLERWERLRRWQPAIEHPLISSASRRRCVFSSSAPHGRAVAVPISPNPSCAK